MSFKGTLANVRFYFLLSIVSIVLDLYAHKLFSYRNIWRHEMFRGYTAFLGTLYKKNCPTAISRIRTGFTFNV